MVAHRVRMTVFVAWALVAFVFASRQAQAQRPGKGLAFAQIAFGGGFETVVNLCNRGVTAYSGTLILRPSDPARPFPALVNGTALAAGSGMNLTLNAGATATVRIKSGDLSVGVVSGFAVILPVRAIDDSLVEGNLTYEVKSADGTIVDSVGVAPSTPIVGTVIPFEDFQAVALALANTFNTTETVRLVLFDDSNLQVGAATQTLAGNRQAAKFLYQYFPGVNLTAGRVEIQSDGFFIGTALTYARGGQASSLPLAPSMKLFRGSVEIGGETDTFDFYMAIDGIYARAYAVDTVDGVPQPGSFENLTGIVQPDGTLALFGRDSDGVFYALMPGFSASKTAQSGQLVFYSENPPGVFKGTITVTAVN